MKHRIAMILPGLGRIQRGAETAFLEIAQGLMAFDDVEVTLFGSGDDVPQGLDIITVPSPSRERFEKLPKLPTLRTEYHYEELAFTWNLMRSGAFDPTEFDATISCTFPWVHWYLRRAKRTNPDLVNLFVTQNGDWMCESDDWEYRHFDCDGLAVINPEYYEKHKDRYRTKLIPNGTDPAVFLPADETPARDSALPRGETFDFPKNKTIILMVSALIESKRVLEGVQAAAMVDDAFLVVAGDGPLRSEVQQLAEQQMPGRYCLLGSLHRDRMPSLFRQADIFLHMSQIEPFGIVYLEAAASGLAIVTHDGLTPRWILGDTALYADSNYLDRVADAIREALSPQVRDELARAARERVMASWTWRAQAAKYRDFLCELRDPSDNSTAEEEVQNALHRDRQLQHA